jgi:hypothetical protein
VENSTNTPQEKEQQHSTKIQFNCRDHLDIECHAVRILNKLVTITTTTTTTTILLQHIGQRPVPVQKFNS